MFSPSIFTPKATINDSIKPESGSDKISSWLLILMMSVFGLGVVLLPWWLWLQPGVSLGFAKVMLLVTTVTVVVIFAAFLALRQSVVRTAVPIPLLCWWGFSVLAVASALLSNDITGSLIGLNFEVHTAGFMVLLGCLMTLGLLFQSSLKWIQTFIAAMVISAGFLVLFHFTRIILGNAWLSFGVFNSVTDSTLGSFNDVAVLAGWLVIALLIYSLRTKRSLVADGIIVVIITGSLGILLVTNFITVWLLVGFLALVLLLFLIRSHHDVAEASSGARQRPYVAMGLTALVCIVAGISLAANESVSRFVGEQMNLSYMEVRPSSAATVSVLRSVYTDNAFLGAGPNQFTAAWRQYKDPSIAGTAFWSTDFAAGSGMIPTLLITTGIFGGIALGLFFISWLHYGYRAFLGAVISHQGWFQVGIMLYAGATYLWVMMWWYTPGVTILAWVVVLSGLALAAMSKLRENSVYTIGLAQDNRSGFIVMAAALVVIISTLGVYQIVGTEFLAHRTFAQIQTDSTLSVDDTRTALLRLAEQANRAIFFAAAAQLELVTLNELLVQSEPTDEDRRRFETSAVLAVQLSERAVQISPTTPFNHALQASIYGTLALAGVPNALGQMNTSLERARMLDPYNPQYSLLGAQINSKIGDIETARTLLAQSLSIKGNYTDALLFLSQLEVAQGNVTEAIAATRAIVTYEPNNATRHYQLGVLLAVNNELDAALAALNRAVALDTVYANARYIRALVHIEKENITAALQDLQIVAESNPNDEQLQTLVSALQQGDVTSLPQLDSLRPVAEPQPSPDQNNAIITDIDPDSNLLTPVNQVFPGSDEATETNLVESKVTEEMDSASASVLVDDPLEPSVE